jgi:hypothetical protein
MSELKPAVCHEMPFAPHGEELGLLIRVTDSRRFAVVAVSTTCGFCVSAESNLPKHQKSSCCGGQVGTLVLAAANALAKRGLLPIEENIIGVRTMAHLELLGPAVAEALGSCKGQLYGAIENKRSAAKPTFLKSLVVLQVAVLEQPLPLDSQQPAAALCLGACASGFAHTWLPLDAAPSVAKAAAKAYAEANAARLPAAVGLLGLQAKATQRVQDSLRELAAAHGERLNVVEGQQAVLLERLTAVEAVLRIQRTQRRRSSSGSAAAASDADTPNTAAPEVAAAEAAAPEATTTPAATSSASSRDEPQAESQAEPQAESAEPAEPQAESAEPAEAAVPEAAAPEAAALDAEAATEPEAATEEPEAATEEPEAAAEEPEPFGAPEAARAPLGNLNPNLSSGAATAPAACAEDDDDCQEIAPPQHPPPEVVDVSGATPPRPRHEPLPAWHALVPKLAAREEAKRAKEAARFRERLAIARMRARERRLLLQVARLRGIFQAALWAALDAGDSDPEFAAYRALDAAGFAVELWDVERDEMRVFTHTCCATRLGEDGEEEGEDDGFAWTAWTFSNDDDLDAEPAYKAKEREGIKLTVAGERIVRCARALLVRRAAMPTDAGGLLRFETVGGLTTWVFA